MTNAERLRVLARLFTRPVLTEIARTGEAFPALSFLPKLGFATREEGVSLAELFEQGFLEIAKAYRGEYVYKAAIANRIIFGRHSPRTAAMQVELVVGRSVVDVAVFNGTSTAYEIKTEFDGPKRLQSQSEDYLKIFDHVYLVTHAGSVHRYEAELDPRVGILTLSAKNVLSVVRPAQSNRHRVESRAIFRTLRQAEYLTSAKRLFGAQPPLPNGLAFAHYEKLFDTLASEQAHEVFVEALRKRTTDDRTARFVESLPPSLRALGFATPLSSIQQERVISAMNSPAPLCLT